MKKQIINQIHFPTSLYIEDMGITAQGLIDKLDINQGLCLRSGSCAHFHDKIVYSIIFEDLRTIDIPNNYWEDKQILNRYRARQNQRASDLHLFIYELTGSNIHLGITELSPDTVIVSFTVDKPKEESSSEERIHNFLVNILTEDQLEEYETFLKDNNL